MPDQQEPISDYYQAARFEAENKALYAYAVLQETIGAPEVDCDLSAYRFLLNQVSHVIVLGQQPTPELEQQLKVILSAGEIVTLPPAVLASLLKRRAQATKIGPWVEGHYRPGTEPRIRLPEEER